MMLRLSKVGVPWKAALIAAVWLAFSPVQIEYSQEVREYSLSVLGALLLLYGLLHAIRMPRRFPYGLCIAVVLVPHLSHGLLFAAAVVLGLYAAQGVLVRRMNVGRLLLLGGGLAVSALLSYELLARDQMANAASNMYTTYLVPFFPNGGLVQHARWMVSALVGYFTYTFGGDIPALAAAAALVVYAGGRLRSLRRAAPSDLRIVRVDDVILLAAVAVAAATMTAAIIDKYPFGGNRQNLFATPWTICAAACAFVAVGEWLRVRNLFMLGGIALLIGASFITGARAAYRATMEDIQSAIAAIDPDAPDRLIYIDFKAQPAAVFYFPGRAFHFISSPRPDKMMSELESSPDCTFFVVATQSNRRYELLAKSWQGSGEAFTREGRFAGAVLYKMEKCRTSGTTSALP